MAKGQLSGAEPISCEICGTSFTPVRRKQTACPPATGRNCASVLANRKRRGIRTADGKYPDLKPAPRKCEKCGTAYQPRRDDARTCGSGCPGRPDYERICANPDCALPGGIFTVRGNSHGKGNQRFCSEKCRDHVARLRQGQRFRRYDGMTREEYEQRGARQQWRCLICGCRPAPDQRRKNMDPTPYLNVDHCHDNGKLRDLLCSNCNIGLGMFADDPERLARAIDYVVMWKHVHADEPVIVPATFQASAANDEAPAGARSDPRR